MIVKKSFLLKICLLNRAQKCQAFRYLNKIIKKSSFNRRL
ncbi:hypothetical protein BBUWI9123_F0012 (plasmid) [Borreliella burgdorferi WI91-23]|nr:hypothetical protein BBUWI9123_F0012 [Borreliella burgdorferi WI91-23]